MVCTFLVFVSCSPIQHWSGAILPTSPADLWPPVRFQHSACVLVDPKIFSIAKDSLTSVPHSQSGNGLINTSHLHPKLFVLWGLSNKSDVWILDVNSTTWKPVIIFVCKLVAVIKIFCSHLPFLYSPSLCCSDGR